MRHSRPRQHALKRGASDPLRSRHAESELDSLLGGSGGSRLVCALCGVFITNDAARGSVAGAHVHTRSNPAGISFEFGCFTAAPGARQVVAAHPLLSQMQAVREGRVVEIPTRLLMSLSHHAADACWFLATAFHPGALAEPAP